MRIWSMHPKYLDSKGLVALWRETLLAKNVLEGKTKGYTNHPQLDRFKATYNSIDYIHYYLQHIWEESKRRGYNFDQTKFDRMPDTLSIEVTKGQLDYEIKHLLNKLEVRDVSRYKKLQMLKSYDLHPMFTLIDGEVAPWERN